MEENHSFTSCMKIRGVSLLPPLITPKRREELLQYKNEAILLEQSYQKKRTYRTLLEQKHTTNYDTSENQSVCSENNLKEVNMKYVPYANSQETTSLYKKNNTDVCECKLSEELNDYLSIVDERDLNYNESKKESQIGADKGNESGNYHQSVNTEKHRLIRSNSYTLDNPSSILLDHLKRSSLSSCDQNITSRNDIEIFESIEGKTNETKVISSDDENLIDLTSNISKTEEKYNNYEIIACHQPSLEVITTDITVQQINFSTSDEKRENTTKSITFCGKTDTKSLGDQDDASSIESIDPEVELQMILQQIPENYAKKIVELIKTQKQEQQRGAKHFEKLKRGMVHTEDFDNDSLVEVSSPKRAISKKDEVTENNDDSKHKELQALTEEKAASIINAYAKGYLVRRLMNTTKVKRIIQTIQDALVCALELQSSEAIEEADVELHRNLIKLVSSACYEFHDIFFALKIPEQMDIIAIDRERLRNTLSVRSTSSSTDLRHKGQISPNIRSSMSLTKI
ncbi:probable serine/threonine-protein kinase DDB_G0283337 isoform X3 [Harmonia axyridis]|uniref:probable serine/threonine-protein kinase DDB_G0283337 isoform X3 n=1 Tax=Harmonia axyridis TaxID=115357 RepID=UPI001E2779BE|nr:probable serine/threonine-protein kinase DDB_G0283337 isoform X3 [Harmonia axyridis]